MARATGCFFARKMSRATMPNACKLMAIFVAGRRTNKSTARPEVPGSLILRTARKEAPPFATRSLNSVTCGLSDDSLTGIPHQLTRAPGPMTRKSKRRSSIVEIGNAPARVRIHTIHRNDGYDQFALACNPR